MGQVPAPLSSTQRFVNKADEVFLPRASQTVNDAVVVAVWLSGNIVGRVNEVTLRRAGSVLRWVTVRGYTVLVFNQATQANSPFHPSGVGKLSIGLLGWGECGTHSTVKTLSV